MQSEEKEVCDEVTALAKKGLSGAQLSSYLQFALRKTISNGTPKKIIKQLLPAYNVPASCYVQIMGALNQLHDSDREQAVKWIALTLQWVDDLEVVHKLFPVFFHYLGYEGLQYATFWHFPCLIKPQAIFVLYLM